MKLAKTMDMELFLYHVATPNAVFPVMVNLGDGLVPLHSDSLLEDAESKRTRLSEWVALAKKEGVGAEYRVDLGLRSQVAERIVAVARAGEFSLLALCAERGAWKAALMGSVVRSVVRDSSCPCWMISKPKVRSQKLAA